MTTATIARVKKKRGLKSLVNQFDIQTTIVKFNPAVTVEADGAARTFSLADCINQMIKSSISFDVSADSFQLSGEISAATKEDIEFLTANASVILCHLRQMLLTRDIFNHEPRLLEDFKTEVKEREALAAINPEDISTVVHTQAVIETTKSWFADIYREFL